MLTRPRYPIAWCLYPARLPETSGNANRAPRHARGRHEPAACRWDAALCGGPCVGGVGGGCMGLLRSLAAARTGPGRARGPRQRHFTGPRCHVLWTRRSLPAAAGGHGGGNVSGPCSCPCPYPPCGVRARSNNCKGWDNSRTVYVGRCSCTHGPWPIGGSRSRGKGVAAAAGVAAVATAQTASLTPPGSMAMAVMRSDTTPALP